MARDGAIPTRLGPRPLKSAFQPSFLTTFVKHFSMLGFGSLVAVSVVLADDWSLVFITSNGHVAIAPTVPAVAPAIRWMKVSCEIGKYVIWRAVLRIEDLACLWWCCWWWCWWWWRSVDVVAPLIVSFVMLLIHANLYSMSLLLLVPLSSIICSSHS